MYLTKISGRSGLELYNNRPVIYVGKRSHGSYPNTNYQAQLGCLYYADYRNSNSASTWDTQFNLIDITII